MRTLRQIHRSKAFALPTVLIASVVLLAVLAVSVTATASVRTALQNQYYTQLAQIAGEAGVAMAKACLAANGNVPLWTDAKPLTPATDCSGTEVLAPSVKALVVAGGGSGGGSTGGGGGAGGIVSNDTVGISATSYPIVVGAGGAAPGNQSRGISGGNSSFNGLVAIGGGGGGHSSSAPAGSGGYAGGSGGGGQNYVGSYVSGAGTAGQGYAGGPLGTTAGSGGGGAGGVGFAGSGSGAGGNGGPGAQYSITGAMVFYGAGGAGGNGGVPGAGGSTTPSPTYGQAPSGAANTGNGGSGGYAYADGNGGAGGSGVVIISFLSDSGIVATATLSPSGTVINPTTSGGYTIYRFTGSGTFNVTSAGSTSCPTNPKCSVAVNANSTVRSAFRIPRPTVDSDGRAVTIPNNGYVEITRASTGAVWRTYTQPAAQAAVVPDLCSGNATSIRGWGQAVKATTQSPLAAASSAQTITQANADVYGGSIYFRKDFNVSKAGTYTLNVSTANGYDIADVWANNQYLNTAAGTTVTASVVLPSGCNSLLVKLTNSYTINKPTSFTLSLVPPGNTIPLAVSDTSWRVTMGDRKHFSEANYQQVSTTWAAARVFGTMASQPAPWSGAAPTWTTVSGDTAGTASWLASNYNITSSYNYPGSNMSWYRQNTPFTTTSAANVRVSYYCDDQCEIYLDGQLVISSAYGAATVLTKNISIQPGTHNFGIRLNNGGASPNASGFLFAAYNLATSTIIAKSDSDWSSTNFWNPSYAIDPYSYDKTFLPSPDDRNIPRGVNVALNFANWTLAGSASYNSSTGELSLGATGSATSPLIQVGSPALMNVGADFYATSASPTFTPKSGNLINTQYFSDGVSGAYNLGGYMSNGCARALDLGVWTLADARCGFQGGPDVKYLRYTILSSPSNYTSSDLRARNPFVIVTD